MQAALTRDSTRAYQSLSPTVVLHPTNRFFGRRGCDICTVVKLCCIICLHVCVCRDWTQRYSTSCCVSFFTACATCSSLLLCTMCVCVCVCVCSDSKERSVARRLWLKQSSILSLQVSGAGVVSLCCHLLATILFPSSDVAPLWAVVHCHRHLKWLFPCGFLVLKRRSFSRKVRACGLPWSPGPVDTKIE